jgi:lipopolysaccharide transport system ATP-binding protein
MQVINLKNISKTYTHYAHGIDRLIEILTRRPRHQAFAALHPMNLSVSESQVVGIIGNNGAGKSTLLKILAGTLQPDGDLCEVKGRVAALLELGGGFHPEMTGRENVYLNSSMMGLSSDEIDAIYDDIVAFAGIEDFMEQPVKTYSSGMFMRLAFAVATSVDPDILIIDEALSVGDGAFARKSFDRIMQFKQDKKTILFCSHSLYQVEKLCDRVIWIDKGHLKMDGEPSLVITAYNETLSSESFSSETIVPEKQVKIVTEKTAEITKIETSTNDQSGDNLKLTSSKSDLIMDVYFSYDPSLPPPAVAMGLIRKDGLIVSSASTHNDNYHVTPNSEGKANVRIIFDKIALLRGEYTINVFLICENAIFIYDHAHSVVSLTVEQAGIEQGVVNMSHQWYTNL